MNTAEVYEKVTNRIIEALEAGTAPWRKPWTGGAPVSIHGRPYRGINAVILAFSGYTSNVWFTFNQARERGGSVRRGEKGTTVLLWKPTKGKPAADGTPSDRPGFYATTYTVFNLEQCEGVEVPAALSLVRNDGAPLEQAAAIVDGWASKPEVTWGGSRACYSPMLDAVRVPVPESFETMGHYYGTLFHELTHSTGHESRLNREGVAGRIEFGSHTYSKEELIAEMGAAFLCARAGIDSPAIEGNQAAYLRNWLTVLKGDRKLLVQAASAAQKAADMILGESAEREAAKAA